MNLSAIPVEFVKNASQLFVTLKKALKIDMKNKIQPLCSLNKKKKMTFLFFRHFLALDILLIINVFRLTTAMSRFPKPKKFFVPEKFITQVIDVNYVYYIHSNSSIISTGIYYKNIQYIW